MANQEQLDLLNQGVEKWNQWRNEHFEVVPNLSEVDLLSADLSGATLSFTNLSGAILRNANLRDANLSGANLTNADLGGANLPDATLFRADLTNADLRDANLSGANLLSADLTNANLTNATLRGTDLSDANLSDANLSGADLTNADLGLAILFPANLSGANLRDANLSGANLCRADLTNADLRDANLSGADLNEADLRDANLCRADLARADLSRADLSRADLGGANLGGATLVETNLVEAILTNCNVYGIATWNIELKGATQNNLVITRWDEEPTITVDNLKIAQFIYLLLNNAEIREVIDTITSKVVLILGRFTPERKAVLDAIKDELRKRNYSPIVFDFEKPASRDLTETISTLAHLARFVIADITDARSIPQELQRIVPDLPSVPIQPLLLNSQKEYGMFEHFKRYPWVLPPYEYQDQEHLLASLQAKVIEPAEQKAKELEKR